MCKRSQCPALGFARTLCVAADNLDPIGVHLVRVVQLEVDVLDNKRPNVVAEPVRVEVTLQTQRISHGASHYDRVPSSP